MILQVWLTAQDVKEIVPGPDVTPIRELVPIARTTLLPSPGSAPAQQLMIEGRGWPWHALWCKVEDNSATDIQTIPPTATISGALVAVESMPQNRPAKLLPYLPYWPGLLANSLVYAFVFSLPIQIVGFRRWRRGKAGHCRGCAYDLSGITGRCPECGREREREA